MNDWTKLLEKNDSLPCPYCGEPTILSDYSGDPFKEIWNKADGYQCINDSCHNRRVWMRIIVYYSEIKYAIKMLSDGHKLPKKALIFLADFQRDRRKSPEFCNNCNSKKGKNEVHLPFTKIVKGKTVMYCEIKIRRERK